MYAYLEGIFSYKSPAQVFVDPARESCAAACSQEPVREQLRLRHQEERLLQRQGHRITFRTDPGSQIGKGLDTHASGRAPEAPRGRTRKALEPVGR